MTIEAAGAAETAAATDAVAVSAAAVPALTSIGPPPTATERRRDIVCFPAISKLPASVD
ncbi:hypothetical protein GCM10017673_06580 [Streptosporangium violaceochromogenes]|nr:hypothetical protein GCM10017673_06580 [Streptosporangium violaceochromogenes]